MIFDKDDHATIVFQESPSLPKFLEGLRNSYARIKNDNLIINLTSFNRLSATDLLEFLSLSDKHRAAGHSFILVTKKVSYDEVPEEINVVPTIQEARDLIEMEEIERDLDL